VNRNFQLGIHPDADQFSVFIEGAATLAGTRADACAPGRMRGVPEGCVFHATA